MCPCLSGPRPWSVSVHAPWALGKHGCPAGEGARVWKVLPSSCASLLGFCPLGPCVVARALRALTGAPASAPVGLLLFPVCSLCFVDFAALLLGAHSWDCCVFLVDFILLCPSVSLVVLFVLKSSLSDLLRPFQLYFD